MDVEEVCVSDDEDDLGGKDADTAVVWLSKEDKLRIRRPWNNSIIAKVVGRKVGFHFLSSKLNSMWRPSGIMSVIDLGQEYFLIKFSEMDDLNRVFSNRHWFIRDCFLAIRQWEHDFRPSTSKISMVAVWVRLPELPMEYYDPYILSQIGNAIGPLLKVDVNTAGGTRVVLLAYVFKLIWKNLLLEWFKWEVLIRLLLMKVSQSYVLHVGGWVMLRISVLLLLGHCSKMGKLVLMMGQVFFLMMVPINLNKVNWFEGNGKSQLC